MESILLDRLAALSHPQRMAIFRLLIRRYPDALPVGEILSVLALKPSTASVYLASLKSVGLVHQRRRGTSLLYSANIAASQDIISGLFSDCCAGRADLCLPQTLAKQDASPTVLFLCTGNSARSIMAETILRDLPDQDFAVASAGTAPRANIHPMTQEVLQSHGHATDTLYSKPLSTVLDTFPAGFDFVFTVCDTAANQDSDAFQSPAIASHWSTQDPIPKADSDLGTSRKPFEIAYETLKHRLTCFAALPFETATRSDLQKMVDDIASP